MSVDRAPRWCTFPRGNSQSSLWRSNDAAEEPLPADDRRIRARRSESATAGVGGSYGSYELDGEPGADFKYFNLDGFWRFYPSGSLFEGWNFGVKAGLTSMDFGTYPGFGFDANRSWLLGKNDNFYVGVGFGLKRLIGDIPEDEFGEPEGPRIIPTLRIVNVGFAF